MTADEQIGRGHITLEMLVAAGVDTMFGAVAGPRQAPERDINAYSNYSRCLFAFFDKA